MRAFSKPIITVIACLLLFVAGFFFLLRGCLSKYDERSAIVPALYFERAGKSVLFSVVKFSEATSYSQKGGFTSKTVSTNYYVQNNDGATGNKISIKKIRHQRDIRSYPVEVLGNTGDTAWVFIGELMAFDPFTLDKKVDNEILLAKNPFIKGRIPVERKYYHFNRENKTISFTASDGTPYLIDTKTLIMTQQDENTGDGADNESKKLEILLKKIEQQKDSLYQHFSRPSHQYAAGKISRREYDRQTGLYYTDRNRLQEQQDSLSVAKRAADKNQRSIDENRRKIESLVGKTNVYFTQIKTNMDSMGSRWYGLYTARELENIYDHFQYQAIYAETGRRQLFTSTIAPDKNGDIIIDKEKVIPGPAYFLDGGFLINKETGMPVRLLGPSSFLVIHKNQIGADGKIQISRTNTEGRVLWTFDTGLKEWADWILTGKQIFIYGTNNKELSSGEVNLLWCIDLATGKAGSYDYFN